jgi:benzoyl-CoA 2,3-dioxygenase component B
MQLEALAQSGFDPLSRTCRFMLTEEAHHMFVGENGVRRVIKKTCEAMVKAGISDPYEVNKIRELGVIDLPTIQKKINLHYTLSLDLFGSEISTNAANTYSAGVKGRFWETKIKDDHILKNDTYPILEYNNGKIIKKQESALLSLNMRLRDDYTKDTSVSMKRWNRTIEDFQINFEMSLPFEGFNRKIGTFINATISPSGEILSEEAWNKEKYKFLPSKDDNVFIESLMKPVLEPGKYASWISAPDLGIDNKPGDFEYVKIHDA